MVLIMSGKFANGLDNVWKVSGWSGLCLESFGMVWIMSGKFANGLDNIWKVLGWSG